jgi:hypothetical protein
MFIVESGDRLEGKRLGSFLDTLSDCRIVTERASAYGPFRRTFF